MLIARITFYITPTHTPQEFVDLLPDYLRNAARIYTANVGERGRVCLELEFADFTEYEKYWGEWGGTPEHKAFHKQASPFLHQNNLLEIWNLHET